MSKRIILVFVIIVVIAGIFFLSRSPAETSGDLGMLSEGSIEIGEKAPDFALLSREGKRVTLYETLEDKPVFLNFWASWCPPCLEEMPYMDAAYRELKNDVEILAVNRGENPDTALEYIDRTLSVRISYPILLDPNEDVSRVYIRIGMPVSYFIAQDGTIIDRKFGPLTEEEIPEKMRALANS